MREGSLEAPVRHPLAWREPDFHDLEKLDAEMRRVFDICHGCRRCFNLCDSFPRLFDLVDGSPTEELDGVKSEDFKPVVDACTLCDLCFMTKCPYVPPHEFNLDFPHLMLRYRAVEQKLGKAPSGLAAELTETDRNGMLAKLAPGIANWASDVENKAARVVMEKTAGVHREAVLPRYHGKSFVMRAKSETPAVDPLGPGAGRKALLYATCFVNFNNPDVGTDARKVLARNGIATEVAYPRCCGMPQLEQGKIERVAEAAQEVARELETWIDQGYDIVALVPSCALMLKFEWPLILPDDPHVKKLAQATFDLSEYVVTVAGKTGLAPGMTAPEGGVTVHIACHARAQNMGQKATEMLRLIPGVDVGVIERCSGHGGSWGIMKENFEVALKVGKPVAKAARTQGKATVVSECPLAGEHILQGMEKLGDGKPLPATYGHPIQVLAKAYGF
jgi:glycerol-3-phosphate dehydrogenase subunit C